MTKEETFYVITWIAQEFLSDDWYKTEDDKHILKNVRVYRRDMTKLDGHKYANTTQNIFEAKRYKTEQNARMALEKMSKCIYDTDYKILRVIIEAKVTSIREAGCDTSVICFVYAVGSFDKKMETKANRLGL